MGASRPASAGPAVTSVLDSRIERLEMEERDAVRRRDWSAARSIAVERTALKDVRQRTRARRGR